jgi:hypothetical protein
MKKHIDFNKQKELNDYLSKYVFDLDRLIALFKQGIPKGKNLHKRKKINGAFRNGRYLGAPGKDVYFALPYMKDADVIHVIRAMVEAFPFRPPSNHVGYAACVRYIYGCFDKQGCLLSNQHKNMMIEENEDWSLPNRFVDKFADECRIDNKNYGLVIYYEMKAHRIGDRIVITNDYSDKLEAMLDCYNKSQKLATKIKCWKHTFTPFYWAACYLENIDKKMAIKYHKKAVIYAEKFCPDARPGYREKMKHSLRYLKKHLSGGRRASFKRWLFSCSNRCIIKTRDNFIK